MGFYKQRSLTNHYLTDADRARIAAIDSNPANEHRKCKLGLTLGHPEIKAQIYIIVYGKDESEAKENIAEHLKFFKEKDKKWKIVSVEDLKKREDDDLSVV